MRSKRIISLLLAALVAPSALPMGVFAAGGVFSDVPSGHWAEADIDRAFNEKVIEGTYYNEQTGEGTGFMFDQITPSALYNTIGWAVYAYYNKKDHIKKMQERGMKSVFSWEDSAKKYLEVYDEALARK